VQALTLAPEASSFRRNDGNVQEGRYKAGEAELGEMEPEVQVLKGVLVLAEEADGSTSLIRGILQTTGEQRGRKTSLAALKWTGRGIL